MRRKYDISFNTLVFFRIVLVLMTEIDGNPAVGLKDIHFIQTYCYLFTFMRLSVSYFQLIKIKFDINVWSGFHEEKKDVHAWAPT